MKKLALVLAFLIGTVASAFATCTGPAVMHDFPGTSFNMSLATVPDGNCGSNVSVPTWAGGTLGAMANYGTSPGAVLVPGTNAFITNTPSVSQSGTWTVQPGNTANTTPWLSSISNVGGTTQAQVVANSDALANQAGVSTNAQTQVYNGTTWDRLRGDTTNGAFVNVKNTPSVNIAQIAGSTVVGDPCQLNAHTFTPINISSNANTKIVAGTAAKKTYICHLYLFGAAADNVGIVEGTGVNCATGTAGVIGGATAATGINLVANQGWVEGSGSNAIAATATNADDFCLITSAASQLSGVAVTVQQ